MRANTSHAERSEADNGGSEFRAGRGVEGVGREKQVLGLDCFHRRERTADGTYVRMRVDVAARSLLALCLGRCS